MKDFAIYSMTSGEVLRMGRSTDPQAPFIGLQEGEGVYHGVINPATHYLPQGELAERPPMAAPVIEAQHVKNHAARLLGRTDWYVMRAMEPDGSPVPDAVLAYRAAVRAASNAVEAMEPIPADYLDAKYWPDQL